MCQAVITLGLAENQMAVVPLGRVGCGRVGHARVGWGRMGEAGSC